MTSAIYDSYKVDVANKENNITIFNNSEFGEIRVLNINNEPWFVGKDVATVLGYSEPRSIVSKKVDAEDRGVSKMATPSGIQEMSIINESGLYSLILSSKLPGAKKFKKWVTSDVLPSIRKHGAYMNQQTIEKALSSPDFLIQLATKLKDEQEKSKDLEQKLETNSKMIRQIEASKNSLLVREVAKILSNKHSIIIGEKRLYNKLREWGWVFKKSTEATQEAIRTGYLEVRETFYETSSGPHATHTTRVTGKGQRKILEKLLIEMEEQTNE